MTASKEKVLVDFVVGDLYLTSYKIHLSRLQGNRYVNMYEVPKETGIVYLGVETKVPTGAGYNIQATLMFLFGDVICGHVFCSTKSKEMAISDCIYEMSSRVTRVVSGAL